jgi:hypothetical protein
MQDVGWLYCLLVTVLPWMRVQSLTISAPIRRITCGTHVTWKNAVRASEERSVCGGSREICTRSFWAVVILVLFVLLVVVGTVAVDK